MDESSEVDRGTLAAELERARPFLERADAAMRIYESMSWRAQRRWDNRSPVELLAWHEARTSSTAAARPREVRARRSTRRSGSARRRGPPRRGPDEPAPSGRLCACGCGRSLGERRPDAVTSSPACRKRLERARKLAGDVYLEREQAALDYRVATGDFYGALDAITDPDGFRAAFEAREERKGSLPRLAVAA
jgi:hypothetical protein